MVMGTSTDTDNDLVSYWDDLQPVSFARACSAALDAARKRDEILTGKFLAAASRIMGEENRLARIRCEFLSVGASVRVYEKVSANCQSLLQGKRPPHILPLDGRI